MNCRTRIKICGLIRAQDIAAAVAAGADALGFVFYRGSPRYVAPDAAAKLIAQLPSFITTTGLFVNADAEEVAAVLAQVPLSLLQFHGDESPDERSEEHTSELQSLMRNTYAVFCLKKKKKQLEQT